MDHESLAHPDDERGPDGQQLSTGGDALVPYTGADAITTREAAVAARAELTRQQEQLRAKQELAKADLERQRKELEAVFAKQRAELEAQMAPLKAQLEKMVEVLWTVDLYLGRDETLRLIRDGAPAPADTPITLRQKVLVMAEESLIHTGQRSRTTGMDADDVPEFITWLTEDDAHLDRVLPEAKGVVVLIPTRVESRSGNIFEDAAGNAENQRSYWLIRNGQRLYLLTVDPKLRIFDRVLPHRREFVDVFDRHLFGFDRRFGEPVRPGSDEWFELEKIADARRRHYMRIMMVLQGILDRTPAWHPLPEGGASFLSLADQDAGKIVLIQDDEGSIQLGEAGETFAQWQRRLNALLRPGLRVIGNWGISHFGDLYVEGDRFSRGYHPRLTPGNAERPAPNVPHLIEARRGGGVVIRYARTEKVYRRGVPVPDRPGYVYTHEVAVEAKQRASCLVMPDDSWVLPFDLVTVPELEKFLYSREERSKHFLTMVPTIRAALEAKRAEAEQEADFRDLIGRLLVMEGADPEPVALAALVDELVHWWKVSHTWSKPLNGDGAGEGKGAHEKKAAQQIVAEFQARQRAASDNTEAQMVALGQTIPGVIAVARDRRGRWHAYAPSGEVTVDGAGESTLVPDPSRVYLDVTRLHRPTADAPQGELGDTETWKLLAQRTATALQVAWSSPEWSTWGFGANPRHHVTGPERARLIDAAITDVAAEHPDARPVAVTEFFDPKVPDLRGLYVYSWVADTSPADTAAAAVHDPFDSYARAGKLIRRDAWRITRDDDGEAVLGLAGRQLHVAAPVSFSSYTGGSKWGSTPWWPDDAHDYGDARPRLVWADEGLLDGIADLRARCRDLLAERDAKRRELERESYRYVRPVTALIRAALEQGARERFEEDFGRDADDLWPAHLESLNLKDPIHPRDLWGIVAIALDHGEPVTGRTLRDLADSALAHGNNAPGEWHPNRGGVDPGEWGDIVVPEPEPEPED